MKVYTAKLGTQPATIQLRRKYGLMKGDRVLYRRVGGYLGPRAHEWKWTAQEGWQEGIVEEEYPYPHNERNVLRLSKA